MANETSREGKLDLVWTFYIQLWVIASVAGFMYKSHKEKANGRLAGPRLVPLDKHCLFARIYTALFTLLFE